MKSRQNNKRNRKNGKARKSESDAILLKGAVDFAIATGASGNGLLGSSNVSSESINIQLLAGRVAVAGTIYTRFRIVSLELCYIPQVGSNTAGSLAIGVLDDTAVSTEALPTDYFATVQLRRVLETQAWNKARVMWVPLDRSKWYYCDSETSNSDTRWIAPAALVANGIGLAASTTFGSLIVKYTIVFAGAVASAAT
jgi:hypothetical protein